MKSVNHIQVSLACTFLMTRSALLLLLGVVTLTSAPAGAQNLTILYSFKGGADGASPAGALVRDAAGNFYGTTEEGSTFDQGTVFKLDSAGAETVLHSFGASGDGFFPRSSLVQDSAGNFYGTAPYGGQFGQGAIFKIDANGNETVFYSFTGLQDGQAPIASLIRDSANNLYGTASQGGAVGYGCVFKVDALGVQTTLYSFVGRPDGQFPLYAGLVHDAAGNFYGATQVGGNAGFGTVFRLAANGQETVLHSFTGQGDGIQPSSTLLWHSGSVYGTTFGGEPTWSGTVFQITSEGKGRTLYTFSGGADGQYPAAGLIRDPAGNLYGTTAGGGAFGGGTVFKLSPAGKETVLHSFALSGDGAYPQGALVRDAAGNLYGTTQSGGTFGFGTVFKLTP